jgi:hypothetical protein
MGQFTNKMLELAQSNAARTAMRKRAKEFDPEFPTNGCASLMSALLERALTAVGRPDDFAGFPRVLDFGEALAARGWQRVPMGQEKAGDIAITKNDPRTGRPAHTFLLVRAVVGNPDVWTILDNQAADLHTRSLSGRGGKTPTDYFLRSNA